MVPASMPDRTDTTVIPLQLVDQGTLLPSAIAEAIRRNVYARHGAPRADVMRWMTEILLWQGLKKNRINNIVDTIIDSLVVIGDVGKGTAFGQEFLVPFAGLNVLLPDGSIIRTGISSEKSEPMAISGRLVRLTENRKNEELVHLRDLIGSPEFHQYEQELGRTLFFKDLPGLKIFNTTLPTGLESWIRFAEEHVCITPETRFKLNFPVPHQIGKIIRMAGSFHPDEGSWTIEAKTTDFLNDWLGIPAKTIHPSLAMDPDQQSVIMAPPTSRLVVEAGPGSGKTYVACERIAHLIRNGIAPPRVWLLSFTRIAAEEMRRRIARILDDDFAARAINVATFDSFAWRLNQRFSGGDTNRGQSFEQSILDAIALIRSGDMAFEDFIGTLDYIIIDEAQDLVGKRRKFVNIFLEKLPDYCGVTILGDFAQGIYGWQERISGHRNNVNKGSSIMASRPGYTSVQMRTDHRTTNRNLADLFAKGRRILGDRTIEPHERYYRLRTLIEESANQRVYGSHAAKFSLSGDSMVLFRGRKPLLATGHSFAVKGQKFRIRLSSRQEIILPWIGALLAGLDGSSRLRPADISIRLEDLPRGALDIDKDTAWRRLTQITGTGDQTITVRDICNRIERNIPVSFLKRYVGKRGPLLSTVHGAKGMEADRVLLMLPGQPDPNDTEVDWDEEARILYVGATRARSELLVGSRRTGRMNRTRNDRSWRGKPSDFSSEIGIGGDISLLKSDKQQPDINWIETVARMLLAYGNSSVPAIAVRDKETGKYGVFDAKIAKDAAIPLCYITGQFDADLAAIAGCHIDELPERLDGFSIMGCTTVVWRTETGGREECGVALAPVLTGFAQVSIGG
jgi:hypothetical protein